MQQNQAFNHFNCQEMKDIRDLITRLTEMILPKLLNNPHENKENHGEYNHEKRLFTGRIYEYRLHHSELSSEKVDWEEFNLLFADDAFLKSSILCLQSILIKMDATQQIYNAEIYKSALVDYEDARENLELEKMNYEKKYNELKQLMSNVQ